MSRRADPAPGPRLRPRRGSWRVALRYASRDARRHKGRTALVAIMVALPAGLGAAAAVLAGSTSDTASSRVAAELGPDSSVQASVAFIGPGTVTQDPTATQYGTSGESVAASDLFRTEDGAAETADTADVLPVSVADYERALAATLPDGDSLAPVLQQWDMSVAPTAHGALHRNVNAYQLATPEAGARFSLDAPLAAGQVAVSADVARDIDVQVGDEVSVTAADGEESVMRYDGHGAYTSGDRATTQIGRYTVAAVVPGDSSLVMGAAGPLDAPTAFDFWRGDQTPGSTRTSNLTWLVVGPRPVLWADITAANALGSTVFSRDVVLHPPADAVAAWNAANPESGVAVSATSMAVVAGAAVLGLLQGVLMIGPAFQVGARRAARDLALLAANGADSRTVRRAVLAGGLVVGTLASVTATSVGAAAAVAGLRAWSDIQPVVPWPWLGVFVLVGMVIALGAAWLPARRAARFDPVLVLAGRRADPPVRRRAGVVGGCLASIGITTALVGAATGQAVMLLVAGIVMAEVGLVVAAGAIVGRIGRLARHLPGTPRLALRDAARHRARTAPAVAAVLAATAAAVAGLVVSAAAAQHDRLTYLPEAATGTVLVGPLGGDGPGLSDADAAVVRQVVEKAGVTDGPLVPVQRVVHSAGAEWMGLGWSAVSAPGTDSYLGYSGLKSVVDDGSDLERLRLLGVPDPDRAAAALAAGRVVVPPGYVATDGTVEVTVYPPEGDAAEGTMPDPVVRHLPATAVGGLLDPPTNLPIMPPSVARSLDLSVGTGALAGRVRPGAWSTAVGDSLYADLLGAVDQSGRDNISATSVWEEEGHPEMSGDDGLALLLITVGALLVALAAAWIATALAGTESLPDLATLQAVGAPPRTRRTFAAAQSSVITITGAVLGAATGLVIGATVVIAQRERGAVPDPRWMVEVPWLWVAALVVSIPVLGALASWGVSRSRLPMTRRLDR
ncbi:ABC transporter permease [Luteimicrobium subarcticum]|uniref:Putative ABC transport system permease protein n=1 Tax=Luteimicrobium subarcticum TaxID=620910 RepID=A0A2M8WQK9_9MICO|nr:ABC transporter permease [Luteimicrobium subarcticum]PJI93225.1 putative ABC transport system permease protein [Luteimicrobium subarcticum]